MTRSITIILLLALAAATAGCNWPARQLDPLTVAPPAAAVPDGAVDFSPLGGALSDTLTEDARVRYLDLAKPPHRDALLALYGQVAGAGPVTRPDVYRTRDRKLAYYINAHNLVALVAIAPLFGPGEVDPRTISQTGRPPETGYVFLVDGQAETLASIRDQRVAPLAGGDPRPLLALCAGRRSDPPLRPEPYAVETLWPQLDDQLARVLNREPYTWVDYEGKRLLVQPAIDQSREWFWNRYPAAERGVADFQTVLMAAAGPRGRRGIARSVGYPVAPLPPADKFNNQPYLRSASD